MSAIDFEISKRVLNVKFNGESYLVDFPNVAQSKEMAHELDTNKEDPFIDVLRKFLCVLGLPMEVSCKMEVFDLEMIAKKFQEQKK